VLDLWENIPSPKNHVNKNKPSGQNKKKFKNSENFQKLPKTMKKNSENSEKLTRKFFRFAEILSSGIGGISLSAITNKALIWGKSKFGGFPVMSSQTVHPRLQMSEEVVLPIPLMISGATGGR
jgi:hypothetical protein